MELAGGPSRECDPPAAAVLAGARRYQSGDYDAAAVLFAAALAHAPGHADARRLRGLALARAGRPLDGLKCLSAVWRAEPGNPLAPLHFGIALLEAGRFARAAAMFRRAAKLAPATEAPWVNLSAALLALGHAPAARAAARRAMVVAPQSPAPLCAMGRAEIAAGRLAEAQQAFVGAIHLHRANPEAWIDLVLVLARRGEINSAQTAIFKGLAACPHNSALESAAAGFAFLAGEQDEAMRRLEGVIARDPGCVAARLNLANALLLDEEPAKALTLLNRPPPPGRDGAHWRAHKAIALLHLGRDLDAQRELDAIAEPYGDAEILVVGRRLALAHGAGRKDDAMECAGRLAALAAGESAALYEHRIAAHFDLARYHYREGRNDQAFEHWAGGHRLLSRCQPFSREEFDAFVAASVEAFDHRRLAAGPGADNADETPIFIVGMPRSGTTLAEQILAAHPLVYGAGERSDLHQLFRRLAGGGATQPKSARRVAALDAACLTNAGAEFLERLHALAPDARRIVDKMPANALHLGFVSTLLPRARIILCRRDPRDIGLSIFQHRFFGYHPYAHDLADLGWYISKHEHLMRHWLDVLPLPIIEIDLADWVRDFDATLARLLAFLDLPPDAACSRFYEQDRRVRTASSRQVREKVNARGLGRWRVFATGLAPMIDELRAGGALPEAEQEAEAGL